MTRIGRVMVRGDDGRNPCQFQTIVENGIAVLTMWNLIEVSVERGILVSAYRRVG